MRCVSRFLFDSLVLFPCAVPRLVVGEATAAARWRGPCDRVAMSATVGGAWGYIPVMLSSSSGT